MVHHLLTGNLSINATHHILFIPFDHATHPLAPSLTKRRGAYRYTLPSLGKRGVGGELHRRRENIMSYSTKEICDQIFIPTFSTKTALTLTKSYFYGLLWIVHRIFTLYIPRNKLFLLRDMCYVTHVTDTRPSEPCTALVQVKLQKCFQSSLLGAAR